MENNNMARIRTIKPEFWEDEKMATLPLACRMMYIGMWNYADDYGIIMANPMYIKSRLFPYDNEIGKEEIVSFLKQLEDLKRIVSCEQGGNHYYLILHFSEHQVINKRSQSKIIPEDIISAILEKNGQQPLHEYSGSNNVELMENNGQEQVKESKEQGGRKGNRHTGISVIEALK